MLNGQNAGLAARDVHYNGNEIRADGPALLDVSFRTGNFLHGLAGNTCSKRQFKLEPCPY